MSSVAAQIGAQGATLDGIARAFMTEAGSDGAVIFVSDGQVLTVGACAGVDPELADAVRVSVGKGVTGLVARNGHAVRLGADAPRDPVHRRLLGLPDGATLARVCLPARGLDRQILAVVAVHRETVRPFSDEDVLRLQPLADLVGLRLQAQDLMNAVNAHRSDRDRLIAHAISAQEGERRRIAFDLHDGVTTALASMAFYLDAAELGLVAATAKLAQPPESTAIVAAQIAQARTLADLAYHQTRAAITGLHSLVLDDLGLVAAIETLVETAAGVSADMFSDDQGSFADLPGHCAAAIFRIAQEAISNAVRHAQAGRVVVTLRRVGNAVVLKVSDDGVGFDVRQQHGDRTTSRDDGDSGGSHGHFGLSSIAERCALIGASLRIESMIGRGTTVIVELPTG